MSTSWNDLIHEDAEDMDWEDISKPVRKKVIKYREEYRERFQEEFDGQEFPRHPYKIMMEVRKEEGLYADNCHGNPELLRGLEMLKEEYLDKWSELSNE